MKQRDTTMLAYTAEDLIAHKLQRGGLLVAKPKFDRDSADLLAIYVDEEHGKIDQLARLCRIQCKGRTITKQAGRVKIPKQYIEDPDGASRNSLVVFVFVETGNKEQTHLLCFFPKDIRAWKSTKKGNKYLLSVSKSNVDDLLSKHRFDDAAIRRIKNIMRRINSKELRRIIDEELPEIVGTVEQTLPSLQQQARGG